jgi:hypothetical protein
MIKTQYVPKGGKNPMVNMVKKHSICFELAQKMVNAAVAKAKELGVSENVAIPKSRCINRLKKHPSHSAPNRRLPVYPAGETLILGGGSETAGVVNCNSAF